MNRLHEFMTSIGFSLLWKSRHIVVTIIYLQMMSLFIVCGFFPGDQQFDDISTRKHIRVAAIELFIHKIFDEHFYFYFLLQAFQWIFLRFYHLKSLSWKNTISIYSIKFIDVVTAYMSPRYVDDKLTQRDILVCWSEYGKLNKHFQSFGRTKKHW